MLPKKELNIYPKNDENINALISYYFKHYDIDLLESLEFLKAKDSTSLNQIEFILRKISEAYTSIFTTNLNGQIKLTNLLSYAFDALTKNEKEWKGSFNRNRITKEFKDFVKKTEVDFDYLEKNN